MPSKTKKPTVFTFKSYDFNYTSGLLTLKYSHNKEHKYEEKVQFEIPEGGVPENVKPVIDALAFYLFMICGTSYYKVFPTKKVKISQGGLDGWQAGFFSMLYKGGLSQYVYENKLDPNEIIEFEETEPKVETVSEYDGEGILLMQSGGKDSLLSAELLKKSGTDFKLWHMSTTGHYPKVLDKIGKEVFVSKRTIDLEAIKKGLDNGGLNGHVPFSAIFAGFALLQAVLNGQSLVIASNEASSDEANIVVDGYSVNHQFSKTFKVELSLQEYIHRYISPQLNYGSLLRPFSELKVGELFAEIAWPKYKNDFSSCNLANYKQGEDNGTLTWDGTCPKCANTFLLFAPFVDKKELLEVFNGKNLLRDDDLVETYRQLFGQSDVKPFECVGTFEEMQHAYTLAIEKDGDYINENLLVPAGYLNYSNVGNHQPIFDGLIDYYSM